MFKLLNKKEILFFTVLIIFCIARCTFECFPDNDLWARLLVGSSIIDGLTIMKRDIFSYMPTHIWYDHEWGSSVFIYAFFKMFKVWGLILLKFLLTFGVIFVVWKTIKLREPKHSDIYNVLFYALALTGATYVMGGTVRCHLFTFLFFVIFIYILEKIRLKGFKHWWIMPLIMLFWSNMHGGCVSGIGLLVMYAVGEALNKKPVGVYIKALIASCLVMFINPWGIGYVIFILKATTMPRGLIVEWLGTFFDKDPHSYVYFKFYLYMMSVVILGTIIRKIYLKEAFDKTKIILIAATMYLSIAHIKHQPFFVLTSAIFLYDDFYAVYGGVCHYILTKIPFITENVFGKLIIAKNIFAYLFVLYFSGIMLSAFTVPIHITNTSYPYYAIEFIKINQLEGKLFINFDWGSYASYKLFPMNTIAMDGRYEECFDPKLINDMNNFHMLKNSNWYDIIEMYPPDIMVIEKKYPVYNAILNKTGWLLVFDNNYSGVFVSEKLLKDEYIYPNTNEEYYNRTMFEKLFDFVKRE